MKRTLTALTVAATMFASSAPAFDPDNLRELKDTIQCESCDLMGADLNGTDLNGANLRDANLGMAAMTNVILCNTTMPDGSVIYSGC